MATNSQPSGWVSKHVLVTSSNAFIPANFASFHCESGALRRSQCITIDTAAFIPTVKNIGANPHFNYHHVQSTLSRDDSTLESILRLYYEIWNKDGQGAVPLLFTLNHFPDDLPR